MHVLNVMQCTNLGGTEHASLRLMQGLQARGHSFEVVSVNALGAFAPKLAENGIRCFGVPFKGKFGWRSHFQLRKTIQSVRADALIMTGPTLSGVLALDVRPAERRILAVHFHHTGVRPAWAWRGLYKMVLSRFQAVTFPSDFIRREAVEILPELAAISHTVYNPLMIPPLPTAEDRSCARKQLGIPADAPVIGNAGWLIRRKRFDVFLQVARRVFDQFPDAWFVIVGDGDLRRDLEHLSIQLRIQNRIRWLGWQQDLSPFYKSIDVLLFNSDWDAMGLTPLEAASFGVPVVASVLHGGLGEILGEGGAALLAEQHHIDRLSEACLKLLSDSEARTRQGREGRCRVSSRCSMQESTVYFEKLLENGHEPRL